jgi:hypothetical protein
MRYAVILVKHWTLPKLDKDEVRMCICMTGTKFVGSLPDPSSMTVGCSDRGESGRSLVDSMAMASVAEVLPHGSRGTTHTDLPPNGQESMKRIFCEVTPFARLEDLKYHAVLMALFLEGVFGVSDSQVTSDIERRIEFPETGVRRWKDKG